MLPLFLFFSLYRPSLDSPSSQQKEGFFLISFLIYFLLWKGGEVWVSQNDKRKGGIVAEGKRMNEYVDYAMTKVQYCINVL